jgi:hypothetical protein
MLEQEVIDAVAAGAFHVWAVRTVDEGIELLTGIPAGERLTDGSCPDGTLHARVRQRLGNLANRLVEFRRNTHREMLTVSRNGHRQRS